MSDRERKIVPDERSDVLNTHCDKVINAKATLTVTYSLRIRQYSSVTYSLRLRQHSL